MRIKRQVRSKQLFAAMPLSPSPADQLRPPARLTLPFLDLILIHMTPAMRADHEDCSSSVSIRQERGGMQEQQNIKVNQLAYRLDHVTI